MAGHTKSFKILARAIASRIMQFLPLSSRGDGFFYRAAWNVDAI